MEAKGVNRRRDWNPNYRMGVPGVDPNVEFMLKVERMGFTKRRWVPSFRVWLDIKSWGDRRVFSVLWAGYYVTIYGPMKVWEPKDV